MAKTVKIGKHNVMATSGKSHHAEGVVTSDLDGESATWSEYATGAWSSFVTRLTTDPRTKCYPIFLILIEDLSVAHLQAQGQ